MEIIKVSAKSHSTAVAGAIAGVMREQMHADVQAIGAGAVNQAIKGIAIARGFLEEDGLEIACLPSFVEIKVGEEERTAVKFSVDVLRQTAPRPGSRLAAANAAPLSREDMSAREERTSSAQFRSAA